MSLIPHAAAVVAAAATQKVVVVNGSPEILGTLESVLAAGDYDIVFVQSNSHAYSHIKRVQPNLVILCVGIDETDGFQVLSMLRLDEETRGIPVFTCTSQRRREVADDEDGESSGVAMFPASKAAVWMN